MTHYVCMVQEGQTAAASVEPLTRGLERVAEEMFGDDPAELEIRWVTIPAGYGFTAGKPSTSSLVVRSVPPGLDQDRRVAFMKSVCDLWQDVTGCSLNEIVVTAYDGPLPI